MQHFNVQELFQICLSVTSTYLLWNYSKTPPQFVSAANHHFASTFSNILPRLLMAAIQLFCLKIVSKFFPKLSLPQFNNIASNLFCKIWKTCHSLNSSFLPRSYSIKISNHVLAPHQQYSSDIILRPLHRISYPQLNICLDVILWYLQNLSWTHYNINASKLFYHILKTCRSLDLKFVPQKIVRNTSKTCLSRYSTFLHPTSSKTFRKFVLASFQQLSFESIQRQLQNLSGPQLNNIASKQLQDFNIFVAAISYNFALIASYDISKTCHSS